MAVTHQPVSGTGTGDESSDAGPMDAAGPADPAGAGAAGSGGGGAGGGGAGTIRPRARLGSRRRQVIAFGILAAALLVLVFRGLGNATVYFKTADEAVAQRAQLGTRRFRIEGTVQPGVRQLGPKDVDFAIANNGVTVNVVHHNGSPELFQAGIPVVLDGHFAPDGHFDSNLIMVKHSASYVAAHPERVTTVPPPTAPAPSP